MNNIKSLVEKGRIAEALDELLSQNNDINTTRDITILKARFSLNESEFMLRGRITRDQYSAELNNIINGVLQVGESIHFTPNIKNTNKSKPKRLFDIAKVDNSLLEALNVYIDKGDYHSARIILLERYGNFFDLPLSYKFVVIQIEQKYGLLETAREHIDYVLKHKDQIKNKDLLLRFTIMNYRILSQERRATELIGIHKDLLGDISKHGKPSYKGTVLNRLGVAYAVEDNHEASNITFLESKKNAIELKLDHTYLTAHCLHAMCALIKGVEFDGNPLKELIKCQFEYLDKGVDKQIWQANVFKSTVQCLFSEAAYYLIIGQVSKGNYRLCLANQLVTLTRANSQTEGYSELVSVLEDVPTIQEKVVLAMNGYENRNAFQSSVRMPIGELLVQTANVYSLIINSPSSTSWASVRELIDKYDQQQ